MLYVLDADALMNAAERFKDHETGVFDKVVQNGDQEEVVEQHVAALSQLLLGSVKVEVDVQTLDELGDGVSVRVRLLLDDLHQVFQHGAPVLLVDDDGGGQIAENVRAHGLDGIHVPWKLPKCRHH